MSQMLSLTNTMIPGTDFRLESMLTDKELAILYQQPVYGNPINVVHNVGMLLQMPSLVTEEETGLLVKQLGQVAKGNSVIIQAGLCAETIDGKTPGIITDYATKMTLMMHDLGGVVQNNLGRSPVMIMRGAGQFAKPRSQPYEATGEMTYRGDIIHGASLDQRNPNARRLMNAYEFSAAVLQEMKGREIYTSHEALSLAYETGLHQDKHAGSGHFLWIGNRTRQIDGPHVKFAAAVNNPIGLKCDGKMKPEELDALIRTINPLGTPGKLTLIFRAGADNVDKELPALMNVVAAHKESVIAICDAVHGNTKTDPVTGKKTRYTDDLICEAVGFVRQCRAHGVHPGGIHLEVSPYDVTECLGEGVTDLRSNYQTLVDPCLNPGQGIKVVEAFCQAYNA